MMIKSEGKNLDFYWYNLHMELDSKYFKSNGLNFFYQIRITQDFKCYNPIFNWIYNNGFQKFLMNLL